MTYAVSIGAIQRCFGARAVAEFVAAGMMACVYGKLVVARMVRGIGFMFVRYMARDRRKWQFNMINILPQKWFRRVLAGGGPM